MQDLVLWAAAFCFGPLLLELWSRREHPRGMTLALPRAMRARELRRAVLVAGLACVGVWVRLGDGLAGCAPWVGCSESERVLKACAPLVLVALGFVGARSWGAFLGRCRAGAWRGGLEVE